MKSVNSLVYITKKDGTYCTIGLAEVGDADFNEAEISRKGDDITIKVAVPGVSHVSMVNCGRQGTEYVRGNHDEFFNGIEVLSKEC